MSEVWRDIDGYKHCYQVSNLGNVRRLYVTKKYGSYYQIKAKSQDKITKYYHVTLTRKDGSQHTENIHRLVAKVFIPNPENKPEVDHIDTVRTNNHVSNLRWVTRKENAYNENTIKNCLKYRNVAENVKRCHKDISIYERKFYHPVVSVSISTGEVVVYEDRMTASRILSLSPSNIWSCIDGKRKSRGGYKWYYLKDYKSICG